MDLDVGLVDAFLDPVDGMTGETQESAGGRLKTLLKDYAQKSADLLPLVALKLDDVAELLVFNDGTVACELFLERL